MHSVSGFFLIVTFVIIGLSILAVYTTILATELGLEKDDMQITSLTHLIKSMDWENDYNEEKIGERILKAQLDDLNIRLESNNTQKNVTEIENNLAMYKSHLEQLKEGVTTNGSFLNLKYQAESEYESFLQSADHISDISKKIGIYELITVLLIIAAGLGGVSEIARNKLLGYPAFIIGGTGVILLFMITFSPSTLI
jgi:predicted RNase H-like nuclease (RuvC/YqgF family)